MAQTPRDNRRTHPALISVDFPVILLLGKKRFSCQARELSEFGIRLAAAPRNLVGKQVQIDLILNPPNPGLPLSGIVVEDIDGKIGIRFERMSPEHRDRLKSYLQARGIGPVHL